MYDPDEAFDVTATRLHLPNLPDTVVHPDVPEVEGEEDKTIAAPAPASNAPTTIAESIEPGDSAPSVDTSLEWFDPDRSGFIA